MKLRNVCSVCLHDILSKMKATDPKSDYSKGFNAAVDNIIKYLDQLE